MQRIPDLTGLKDEVVIPSYSRNVYDHAVRMTGVKIIEVKDPSELATAFNERTAMVYILGGPGDEGPLGTKAISEVAKKHGVPVVVDAAAEILTLKPNVHLARGASVVVYSGGKCIRGPQAAGLLLGEKNLLQSAWANSAPHHAFGRSLKVGKEEIMGMLAAVEMWVKRDHEAEWKTWIDWCNQIGDAVKRVDGVTVSVSEPREGLSNRTPQLNVKWDGAKLGITGTEVHKLLTDTEPRIILASGNGARPANMASSVSVVPYMLMPGDVKVVGDRLYNVLSKPPKFENPPEPQPPTVLCRVSGRRGWNMEEVGDAQPWCSSRTRRKRRVRDHAEFDAGIGAARVGERREISEPVFGFRARDHRRVHGDGRGR